MPQIPFCDVICGSEVKRVSGSPSPPRMRQPSILSCLSTMDIYYHTLSSWNQQIDLLSSSERPDLENSFPEFNIRLIHLFRWSHLQVLKWECNECRLQFLIKMKGDWSSKDALAIIKYWPSLNISCKSCLRFFNKYLNLIYSLPNIISWEELYIKQILAIKKQLF